MSGATGAVIGICWAVWGVYWLLAAFRTKRTVERGGLLGYRLLALVLTGGVIVVFRAAGYAVAERLWPASTAVGVACDCLVVAGTAFSIWARIVLGRNWSAEITFKQGHELIESGPYAIVRHPIYTGMLAMVIGTAVAYARPIGFALLLGLFGAFWWKAREEEQVMSRHFPAAYAEYKSRVPAIIPFLV
jgi:protein-S-isoprenylcysteine O-methyltransferase Ste14